MKNASASYEDGLRKDLADPEEAAAYLNAAFEEGSPEMFLLALRDVAGAKGMSEVARESTLNRESLYRLLSEKGNPQLSSLNALLETLGLKLAVQVKRDEAA